MDHTLEKRTDKFRKHSIGCLKCRKHCLEKFLRNVMAELDVHTHMKSRNYKTRPTDKWRRHGFLRKCTDRIWTSHRRNHRSVSEFSMPLDMVSSKSVTSGDTSMADSSEDSIKSINVGKPVAEETMNVQLGNEPTQPMDKAWSLKEQMGCGTNQQSRRKTRFLYKHQQWRRGENLGSPRSSKGLVKAIDSFQISTRTPDVKPKRPTNRIATKSRTIIDYTMPTLVKATTKPHQDSTVKHNHKPDNNNKKIYKSSKTTNANEEKKSKTAEPESPNPNRMTVNVIKNQDIIKEGRKSIECRVKGCQHRNKFRSSNHKIPDISTEIEAFKTYDSKLTAMSESLKNIVNVTLDQCVKNSKLTFLENKVSDANQKNKHSSPDINFTNIINKNKKILSMMRHNNNRRRFYRRYVSDENICVSTLKNETQTHRSKHLAKKYRQTNNCAEGQMEFVTLTNQIDSKLNPRKTSIEKYHNLNTVNARGSVIHTSDSNIDVKSVSTSLIQDYLFKTIKKHKHIKYSENLTNQRRHNKKRSLLLKKLPNKIEKELRNEKYEQELKNIDESLRWQSINGSNQDYTSDNIYQIIYKYIQADFNKKQNSNISVTFANLQTNNTKDLAKVHDKTESKPPTYSDSKTDDTILDSKYNESHVEYENSDIPKYQSTIIRNVLKILKNGTNQRNLCSCHTQFIISAVMIIIKAIVNMNTEHLEGNNLCKLETGNNRKYTNKNVLLGKITKNAPENLTHLETADIRCKKNEKAKNENKEIDVLFSSRKLCKKNNGFLGAEQEKSNNSSTPGNVSSETGSKKSFFNKFTDALNTLKMTYPVEDFFVIVLSSTELYTVFPQLSKEKRIVWVRNRAKPLSRSGKCNCGTDFFFKLRRRNLVRIKKTGWICHTASVERKMVAKMLEKRQTFEHFCYNNHKECVLGMEVDTKSDLNNIKSSNGIGNSLDVNLSETSGHASIINAIDSKNELNKVSINITDKRKYIMKVSNSKYSSTDTDSEKSGQSISEDDIKDLDCDKNISFEIKTNNNAYDVLNIVESCDECIMASIENDERIVKLTQSLYNCDECRSADITEKLITNIAEELEQKYLKNHISLKDNCILDPSLNRYSSVILRATYNERIQTNGDNFSDDGGLLYLDCSDVHDGPVRSNRSSITINCSFIRKKNRGSLRLSSPEKHCSCSGLACLTKNTKASKRKKYNNMKNKLNEGPSSDESDAVKETKHSIKINQEKMFDSSYTGEEKTEYKTEGPKTDSMDDECKQNDSSDYRERTKHKTERSDEDENKFDDNQNDSEVKTTEKSKLSKKDMIDKGSTQLKVAKRDSSYENIGGCGGITCSKNVCRQKYSKIKKQTQYKGTGDKAMRETKSRSKTNQDSTSTKKTYNSKDLYEKSSGEILCSGYKSALESNDHKPNSKDVNLKKPKEKQSERLDSSNKRHCAYNNTADSTIKSNDSQSKFVSETLSFSNSDKVNRENFGHENKNTYEKSTMAPASSCAEIKLSMKSKRKKETDISPNKVDCADYTLKKNNKSQNASECVDATYNKDNGIVSRKKNLSKFKHSKSDNLSMSSDNLGKKSLEVVNYDCSGNRVKNTKNLNGKFDRSHGHEYSINKGKLSQETKTSNSSFGFDCSGNKVKNSNGNTTTNNSVGLDCSGNKVKFSKIKNAQDSNFSRKKVKISLAKESSCDSIDQYHPDSKRKKSKFKELLKESFGLDCSGNRIKSSKIKKTVNKSFGLDCFGNKVKLSNHLNDSDKSFENDVANKKVKNSKKRQNSEKSFGVDDTTQNNNTNVEQTSNARFGYDCSRNKVKILKIKENSGESIGHHYKNNKVDSLKENETFEQPLGMDYSENKVRGSKSKNISCSISYDFSENRLNMSDVRSDEAESPDYDGNKHKSTGGKSTSGYDCFKNKVNILKSKDPSNGLVSNDYHGKNRRKSKKKQEFEKLFELDCSGNKIKSTENKKTVRYDCSGNKFKVLKDKEPSNDSHSHDYTGNKSKISKKDKSPTESFDLDCSGNKVTSLKVRNTFNGQHCGLDSSENKVKRLMGKKISEGWFGVDCSGNKIKIAGDRIHSRKLKRIKNEIGEVGSPDRTNYSKSKHHSPECKINSPEKYNHYNLADKKEHKGNVGKSQRKNIKMVYEDDEPDVGDDSQYYHSEDKNKEYVGNRTESNRYVSDQVCTGQNVINSDLNIDCTGNERKSGLSKRRYRK